MKCYRVRESKTIEVFIKILRKSTRKYNRAGWYIFSKEKIKALFLKYSNKIIRKGPKSGYFFASLAIKVQKTIFSFISNFKTRFTQ